MGAPGAVSAPPPEPPIYVYSSHSERLLYFPDLERFDPIKIGPGIAVELRWVRGEPRPQEDTK